MKECCDELFIKIYSPLTFFHLRIDDLSILGQFSNMKLHMQIFERERKKVKHWYLFPYIGLTACRMSAG